MRKHMIRGACVVILALAASTAQALVIAEFRVRGPNGANDEYIVIENNTGVDHTVAAISGSGYGIAASDGITRCSIPNGTVIPNRGHYLCVNSVGYSLASYPAGNGTTATGDATFTTNIPDNAGIALFNNNTGGASYSLANRLDAVGSTSEANTLYKEGTGYPALTPFSIDYAFVRDTCGKGGSITTFGACPSGGATIDTNNNAANFIFVDTNGTSAGAGQRLGAPGPRNLSSPLPSHGGFATGPLDSCVGETSPPNRVRDFTSNPAQNSTFGTIDHRFTFTNNTGGNITRLRMRIVDLTTFPAPAGIADLRPRTSTAVVVTVDRPPCGSGTSNVTVQGTTLEQPPSQPNGGGFNSSLSVGVVTLATPIANGATVDLRVLFGIQQTGAYKFGLLIEALPAGGNAVTTEFLEFTGCTDGGCPAVTVDQAVGQADPTAGSPINFTAVFGSAVTGFDGSDVTLGGTAGATTAVVTGGPTTYNIAVSGMTSSGTVTASIPGGAALAGAAPNYASTSTDNTVNFVLDAIPPTVTIDQAVGQVDPTATSPINFTVVFSEPVTGFTNADVTLGGTAGATTAVVTGGPTTYNVAVSGMTANGTVTASIGAGVAIDGASNPNAASTSTDNTVSFTGIDATPPSVTINQAVGQVDPTATSPINFTVVFSESVTGFATGDITLAGTAGATTAVVSGGPATYNVAVSGMTANGTVTASIGAGVAIDGASNPNAASTSTDNTVSFTGIDVTAPTVTINQAAAQVDPTSTSPINFTVVFSEAVTGFATGDITLAGTAGATTAVVSGGPTTFNVAVSGMTANGTVIASIAAGVAIDGASNPNAASTSADNSVTWSGSAVTTFTGPTSTGTGSATAGFTGGGATCTYASAQFIAPPPGAAPVPPTLPPVPVTFPHGLFDFTLQSCAPGGAVTVTVTYPSQLPAGSQYWKYGPTPGQPAPHWYVLPATIAGNTATFTIVDGGLGDDDLVANGTIVDQGGPGVPQATEAIPALSPLMLALLALLTFGSGTWLVRRR